MIPASSSHKTVSRSRQKAAVEALIAIVDGVKQKPKPAQVQMLLEDARAAVKTLGETAQ